MKKATFILPLLMTIVMSCGLTSCSDEYFGDSNTRVMEATVFRNQWCDDGSGYLWCSFDWNALTVDVLNYGNISAYVYDGNRQCPLPHVVPITYTFDDGSYDIVTENIRYDFEPGKITFIMEDHDGALPENINTDLTFRVVATMPVE